MGLGQQSRLEDRLAGPQGGGHVHRAHQPVFRNAQGYLHKRCRDHLGGQQGAAVLARGVAAQLEDASSGGQIPVIRPSGVDIQGLGGAVGLIAAQIEHVDRRQQGMQCPGQHRFAGAPTTGDYHATEAGIHGRQQQGQLEAAVAGDGGQGKGAGRGLVAGRSACNHGWPVPHRCGLQSR